MLFLDQLVPVRIEFILDSFDVLDDVLVLGQHVDLGNGSVLRKHHEAENDAVDFRYLKIIINNQPLNGIMDNITRLGSFASPVFKFYEKRS